MLGGARRGRRGTRAATLPSACGYIRSFKASECECVIAWIMNSLGVLQYPVFRKLPYESDALLVSSVSPPPAAMSREFGDSLANLSSMCNFCHRHMKLLEDHFLSNPPRQLSPSLSLAWCIQTLSPSSQWLLVTTDDKFEDTRKDNQTHPGWKCANGLFFCRGTTIFFQAFLEFFKNDFGWTTSQKQSRSYIG